MKTKPTPRQLEAFSLRCQGLKYADVALQLGVTEKTALLLAQAAASRLILAEPSPAIASNRALALTYFPKIAKEHGRTS
jgi:hypothetical protein